MWKLIWLPPLVVLATSMNLWAQTYMNGRSYYREQRASRSHGECPATGGSIPCEIPDRQVGEILKTDL